MATHHELHERYGSRRLWRELRRRGIDCGRHRMDRLRREQGLCTRRRRRFMRARAAYQRTPAAPRLCTWPFAAHAPDRLWVGDMTVLPTREGPLYFAALVDACSRRVIGWAMDDHQRLDLTERALEMALQQRRPKPGLLLHHDRGSQYTGARYRAKAEAAKIQLSMSRPGLPYDNAMAESFFATLKLELMDDNRSKPATPHARRCSNMSNCSTTASACTRHSATGRRCRRSGITKPSGLYPDYPSVECGAVHSDPFPDLTGSHLRTIRGKVDSEPCFPFTF